MTPEAGVWGRVREYAVPFVAFLVVATIMSKVQLSVAVHHATGPYRSFTWAPTFTDMSGKLAWGAGDYRVIATSGYPRGAGLEAAFPGFALLIRYLAQVLDARIETVETVSSLLSGLAATLLLWKWLLVRGIDRPARVAALAVFLAFPYSFMIYGIGYNDVLLLPLVIGAFVLVETDRPVLAGLVGALATFTRPNAVALLPALVVFELVTSGAIAPGRHLDLRRMGVRRWGVLLSAGGIAAYAAWLARHTGSPFTFLTAQQSYGHLPLTNPNTLFKIGLYDNRNRVLGLGLVRWNHLLAAVVLVAAVALLPRLVRRLGWAYGAFAISLLAITWVGTIGFAPAGRYLLPALPFYAGAIGDWLAAHRRVAVVLVIAFGALSLWLTVLFARTDIWLEW